MAIKKYSKREVRLDELYTGEARCAEIGDVIFFDENLEPGLGYSMARRVCATCVLIDKCRDYGIQNQVYGVWGGTTLSERREFRKKNGIVAKELY
jgi:hypothetical protein